MESAYKTRTHITERTRMSLCVLFCLRKCMTGHRDSLNERRNTWLQNRVLKIQHPGGNPAMELAKRYWLIQCLGFKIPGCVSPYLCKPPLHWEMFSLPLPPVLYFSAILDAVLCLSIAECLSHKFSDCDFTVVVTWVI